jgi:hypothetical protein
MTKHVWVVTFHYDRGHSETETFSNKADALRCVDVAVFKNEDCINCSIHRKDITLSDALAQAERLFEIRDKILGKM